MWKPYLGANPQNSPPLPRNPPKEPPPQGVGGGLTSKIKIRTHIRFAYQVSAQKLQVYGHNTTTPKIAPFPPSNPPGGGVGGGVDFKNKNSHPNRVYTPSLSLIALKMWPQPTYPQNISHPQGTPLLGGGGI